MTRPYLTVDTEDAALINANATTTAASTASTAASTSNIVNNASTTSRTSNIAADTSANIATSSTCKNQSLRRNIEYIFYWVGKHAAARALFYLTVSILFMFIVSYPALRAQLIRLRLHQVDQDRFWRNPVVSQTVIDHIKHEAGIGKSIHLQRFFIDLPVVDATNDTATTDILSPDQWYAAYQVELFLAQVLNNARAKNVTSCLITKSLNIKRQYNIADELCFIMGPWSNPQQMLTSQPEIAQNDSLHNYKHMLNSIIANQDEWKRSNLFDEWLEQIHRLRLPSIDEELTVGSLAGIKYDWRQQRVKAIHSIVLSYFYVTDENTSSIPSLSSVLMEKQPLGIQFTFPNTTASVPHAIKIRSHTHPLDPPIGLVMIFAVLTCVFFCASYSLGSVELVKSKNGIGFAAVLSIIFSWSMSYGFSAVLGIVYEVMPSCELHMLMVLVSCIENMFIVTNSVVSTSMDLPVAERVGRGFRAVGIPMSTGALVQIGILWMGFFFSTGALKEFCLLMVFTICYSHILQLLFLVPILCIDIRRLELADLHDRRVVRQIQRFPSHGQLNIPDQSWLQERESSDIGESRVTVLGISVRRYHTLSIIGIIFCLLTINTLYSPPHAIFDGYRPSPRPWDRTLFSVSSWLPLMPQAPIQLPVILEAPIHINVTDINEITTSNDYLRHLLLNQLDLINDTAMTTTTTTTTTTPIGSDTWSLSLLITWCLWLIVFGSIVQISLYLYQLYTRNRSSDDEHKSKVKSHSSTSNLSTEPIPTITWLNDGKDPSNLVHTNEIHHLDVNSHGSVVSASVEGIVALWRVTNQRSLLPSASTPLSPVRLYPLTNNTRKPAQYEPDELLCTCVLIDPQDMWAAAGYEDGSVGVWRLSDGQPLHQFQPRITREHYSSNDDSTESTSRYNTGPVIKLLLDTATYCHLIVVRQSGQLQRWDLISGHCEQTWYHTVPNSTTVTPLLTTAHITTDSRYIYTADRDGYVNIWQLHRPSNNTYASSLSSTPSTPIASTSQYPFPSSSSSQQQQQQQQQRYHRHLLFTPILSEDHLEIDNSNNNNEQHDHRSTQDDTQQSNNEYRHTTDEDEWGIQWQCRVQADTSILCLASNHTKQQSLKEEQDWILAGCLDGTVWIWRVKDGHLLKVLAPSLTTEATTTTSSSLLLPITRLVVAPIHGLRAGDFSTSITAIRSNYDAILWRVFHADDCQCTVHAPSTTTIHHHHHHHHHHSTQSSNSNSDNDDIYQHTTTTTTTPGISLAATLHGCIELHHGEAIAFPMAEQTIGIRQQQQQQSLTTNTSLHQSNWEFILWSDDNTNTHINSTIHHEEESALNDHELLESTGTTKIIPERVFIKESIPLTTTTSTTSTSLSSSTSSTMDSWRTRLSRLPSEYSLRSRFLTSRTRNDESYPLTDTNTDTMILPFTRIHCMAAAEPFAVIACGNRIVRVFIEQHQLFMGHGSSNHLFYTTTTAPSSRRPSLSTLSFGTTTAIHRSNTNNSSINSNTSHHEMDEVDEEEE